LKGCRTVKAVEDALHRLPKTLDATYARIVNDIPEEDRERAFCVLHFLISSYRALTIDEVAEAVTVNCEEERVDYKLKLRDPFEILEICSGLIELSGFVLI
jgi:hypothetical protein